MLFPQISKYFLGFHYSLRFYKIIFHIILWALRLPRNWVISWKGFDHEDFRFIDGVILALQNLIKLNYEVIIVTNQSGIGRGLFSKEDYLNLTKKYVSYLKKKNIYFLDIYHCPHSPDSLGNPKCSCRKPLPGMLIQASKDHNIKLSETIMVGDKISDMNSAKSAGIKDRYLLTQDQKLVTESKDLIKRGFKTLLEFTNFLESKNQ